jgi:diaminopropionate ammonia-lyase
MLDPYPFTVFPNPRVGTPGLVVLPEAGFQRARAEIAAWPGYALTSLRDLPVIARQADVAAIRLKDEAGRFGLGSFKALGGAYAVAQLLANELARRGVTPDAHSTDLMTGRWRQATEAITVTCATDGNHGRAVAWGAQRCHCRAVIFVHETVSAGREAAIAAYGAEIHRVAGTYDDAVRAAAIEAEAQGWFVVSDTSWPGYVQVPQAIMQGYRVMAAEAVEQWGGNPPTHVFIQGGVGGVAAAVSVQMRRSVTPPLRVVVVEPDRAACLLASAELGERTSVPGNLDTLMAGLACGEPSLLAWQELERGAAAFMAIPDEAAVATMRLLARAGIIAGESGVAGLAGCLLAAADPAARGMLGLDAASRVLVFSTEGATDPELYEQLVGPPRS